MQRRRLIAGNWKMNKTPRETEAFIAEWLPKSPPPRSVDVLVIPPFTSLSVAAEQLASGSVFLGGQDLYFEPRGAFTGAISADMLRGSGCSHVLVGHSERREVFGDSLETVRKKLGAALDGKLLPILCVGERLADRRAGRTSAVLLEQLETALSGVPDEVVSRLTVAYEPIWAIGTGETASPLQAQEAASQIRRWLERSFGREEAGGIRILYGGSVKPENIRDLVAQQDIDGGLVGGASLDPDAFARIVEGAGS